MLKECGNDPRRNVEERQNMENFISTRRIGYLRYSLNKNTPHLQFLTALSNYYSSQSDKQLLPPVIEDYMKKQV